MKKTKKQFAEIIKICQDIYIKKLKDYGTAWRILRPSSLTDQILIKAQRIRSFEIKQIRKINENSNSEFIGIVNYAIISLIQLELGYSDKIDLDIEKAIILYDNYIEKAKKLMFQKNHDYDEAWRSMRISSFTDLILMKIYRTKQIEDNKGETLISEGVDANYYDMINYSIFGLIKLKEEGEELRVKS